jgi:hypothetical protein
VIVKIETFSEDRDAHNPKVGGSNPPPAINNLGFKEGVRNGPFSNIYLTFQKYRSHLGTGRRSSRGFTHRAGCRIA